MPFSGPEDRTARVELILDELRQSIIAGDFAPGAKLRAEPIARSLRVSPTPVREAFQRLAAEGLVAYSSQRGIRVTEATLKDLDDLYSLRRRLEPWALELSMSKSDSSARRLIRSRHRELNRWYANPTTDLLSAGYERTHRDFHSALVASCDSDWLIRTVTNLAIAATRYRNLAVRAHRASQGDMVSPKVLLQSARHAHAVLATAVLSNDIPTALQTLEDHLESAQIEAKKAFREAR